MKARINPTLILTCVLFTALLAVNAAGAAPPARPPNQAAPAVVIPAVLTVRINEVMPIPSSGGHDWVELLRVRATATRYLPLVSRLASGQEVAVEPSSFQLPAAGLAGWQLGDGDGHFYTIPAALPPVPMSGRVLVYFDGLGPAADDYDFSDGVAVLHTGVGLVDILDNDADQVALYTGSSHNSQTLRSFMVYGGPPAGQAATDAVTAGLWPPGEWVSLSLGAGAQEAGSVLSSRSVGVVPNQSGRSPDDWAIYLAPDFSPGAANPVPRAYWSTTADGATMGSDGFALGWAWTPGAVYEFQMDDDPAFGSPLVNTTLVQPRYVPATPPPAGAYWWRVRAIVGGVPAAWSTPARVTVIAVVEAFAAGDEGNALTTVDQTVLAMTWLRQRKDSRLLCLDGDNEGDPASAANEEAWDAVHPDAIYTHGRNNCVRASIAMIVTHYGGNLSQDRLAYRLFENNGSPIENIGQLNNPHLDLGHDRTTLVCGGDGSNGGALMAWALGINVADYTYGHINTSAKPSFAQIQAWINAGRPIMRFNSGHQTVIGGYRTLGDGTQQIRLFDPWSATTWETYSGVAITCWYVPPAAAPGVRSDEATIWSDADGDGIMDWDEQVRFHTDPTKLDSDQDWVQDKKDIREYVFNTAGTYSLRNADMDGDGLRKELDPDNDADGSVDGCEDTNYNGKYEAGLGETDNFNAASHQTCTPQFEILEPTQSTPVNAGAYNNPDKIFVQVKTATPPSSPVTYGPGDFSVQIGGRPCTVQAAYRVADTHFLVVQPATQTAADYYDLRVQLGTQSDAETRAVFYLPRLRADQVLVLDRSGSMADYGKLDAAKNAARAFIDHANVGDMIGVVSFATTAGPAPDYPLTTIVDATQWDAAKTAVNGLIADGTTALGQGALLGYNEIVARGQSDHDWTMALLSDGMENVAPYWDDPAVSGVIIPSRVAVSTVALGYDADLTLMAAIASQTGGTFYQAGVDLLPLAASETPVTSPAVPPGPNVPSTLPNRLADVYKAIGEQAGHQQRLWEKTGTVSGRLSFEVPVEKGLPEAIFAVNWDDPGSPLTMSLTDPNGNPISPTGPGVIFRNDPTHQQYRIASPQGGVWVVLLVAREKIANYLFILSGWSRTTMHLGFGLLPRDRIVGAAIPVLVYLGDTKPILGAEVWAFVQGPNSDIVQSLRLFDDGGHEDGRAGDGVYGNLFTRTYLPGPYFVKASAWGVNNSNESFIRHRTGSFRILPNAAYIWLDNLPIADDYRQLLEAHGFHVDLIPLANVPTTNWSRYSLAVIGPDTGQGASWGTPQAVATLAQYPVPILGLGRGGEAFFGELGLAIGFPNAWYGTETRTYAMDTAHQVWNSPYDIPLPRERVVTLYKRTTHEGVYVPRPTSDMTLLGREPADQTHYNLIQQTSRFLLWGFDAGPAAMTEDGWHLLVNVARYLAGW